MEPKLLALWAVPRSRSTALFRMMVGRRDRLCIHEPFNDIHDLGRAVLPDATGGRIAVAGYDGVALHLVRLSEAGPVVFKETLEHDYALRRDPGFLAQARHAFIIRNPVEVVLSHLKLNPELTAEDVGFDNMQRLLRACAAATGVSPVVLNTDDLMDNPSGLVAAFCDAMGIGFRPEDLSWEEGGREEWARTQRWHAEVSKTTGFQTGRRPVPPLSTLPSSTRALIEAQMPAYGALNALRLRAEEVSAQPLESAAALEETVR